MNALDFAAGALHLSRAGRGARNERWTSRLAPLHLSEPVEELEMNGGLRGWRRCTCPEPVEELEMNGGLRGWCRYACPSRSRSSE